MFVAAHLALDKATVAQALFGARRCSSRLGQGLFPVLLILAWGMQSAMAPLHHPDKSGRPALRISREALP